MTSKSKSQKGAAGKRATTTKARAEAIITNAAGYDFDTRAAVRNSLRSDDTDTLAEIVRRAERGETILDTIGAQEDCDRAALAFKALVDAGGLPPYVRAAMLLAVNTAAQAEGFDIHTAADPNAEGFDLDAGKLAHLFALTLPARIELEPKRTPPDLAEMIVAVWDHPDCPKDIRDGIDEATTELFNTLNEGARRVYKTAPYVRALILEHKAQKGDAS